MASFNFLNFYNFFGVFIIQYVVYSRCGSWENKRRDKNWLQSMFVKV